MGVVLITRPEPAAQDTAARLAALGHSPMIAPFLVVEPLQARLPAKPAAVLITSANAAHAIPPGIPVFAVGDATAARARAHTEAPVFSAAADAAALAQLVARHCDPAAGALLLLSGVRQGKTLAAGLRTHGFRVIRRAVYRTAPPRQFPAAAQQAIEQGATAVLFFSPETARIFVRLFPPGLAPALARVRALTLSPAISRALAPLPWQAVAAAAHPSQETMLKLL